MKIINIRKYQIALVMFLMSIVPCLAGGGIFSIEEEGIGGYVKHYNTLPPVEEADASLKSQPQFSNFLERSREIIESYEFSSHTGLRLIHRHFDLDNKKVIVQESKQHDGKPALIASPFSLDEALSKEAVPSGWIFGNSRHIFEFSTDEAVKADLRHIQNTPEFLDKMENLIKEFKLDSLISVSLLRNASLVPQDGEIYLETTYDIGSVVQVAETNNIKSGSICTAWAFGPKQAACNGSTYCQSVCAPRYDGDHYFGGHKNVYTHRTSNSHGNSSY
jgi:hypothetical protein